ncbi:MAG: hypothetical protein D6B25_11045 [Desulfobulbaceae bacterium]|nr:MAG: hypothetical protein D6B25_11045 [Desulfobulbaceae bacterium]
MSELLVVFLITAPLLIGAAAVINFCKRRVAKTRHPLSGMCHKKGGAMCTSCSSALSGNQK